MLFTKYMPKYESVSEGNSKLQLKNDACVR
jgi:hypothetical protein